MGRSNSESSNPVSAVTTSFRARERNRTAHACKFLIFDVVSVFMERIRSYFQFGR
jgi:hypothetical protein